MPMVLGEILCEELLLVFVVVVQCCCALTQNSHLCE